MQRCTWTCRGVVHSFCTVVKWLSEPKKRCQDCLMSSAQSFYGARPCLQSVAHSLTCGFSRNLPLLHMSRYTIARDQFYQAFPFASNKCWGGYEASTEPHVGMANISILVECRTLWGEPERVHVQNMAQLHAHDRYQNVTEHKASGHSI